MSPLSRFLRYLPFHCHKCMASSNLQTTRKTLKIFANKTSLEITVTCADRNGRGGCQPLVFRGSPHFSAPEVFTIVWLYPRRGEGASPPSTLWVHWKTGGYLYNLPTPGFPSSGLVLFAHFITFGGPLPPPRPNDFFLFYFWTFIVYFHACFLLCSSLRFPKRYEC